MELCKRNSVMEKDYYAALAEHLENREWSEVQVMNMMHKVIGNYATVSAQTVLEVLEMQQEVDECIASKKEFDRAFVPQSFFEDTDYTLEAKWDEVGKYLGNPEGRDI